MPRKSDTGSADWTDEDDAPVLTESETAEIEVFQGDAFVARRGRGRPRTGNAKELISVRLDPEVLGELRRAGPGWQSQVNVLLRQGLGLSSRGVAPIKDDETVEDAPPVRRKRQHA